MVGENSRKKLERGKSLYDQSETIFLGKELPDKLLDNGYMLTHASPTGDVETLITKEACDEHFFHYVVAITKKRFIVGHMQTPGTLIFVFNSWEDLARALPLAPDKFRKLELQVVIDAANSLAEKESSAIQKKSDIITPAQFRAMKDRKRFR